MLFGSAKNSLATDKFVLTKIFPVDGQPILTGPTFSEIAHSPVVIATPDDLVSSYRNNSQLPDQNLEHVVENSISSQMDDQR